MAEPDNLVLEHLRAIRGEVARLANWMESLNTEMTAFCHHVFGAITPQSHDHFDIAEIMGRLGRMEHRLERVD